MWWLAPTGTLTVTAAPSRSSLACLLRQVTLTVQSATSCLHGLGFSFLFGLWPLVIALGCCLWRPVIIGEKCFSPLPPPSLPFFFLFLSPSLPPSPPLPFSFSSCLHDSMQEACKHCLNKSGKPVLTYTPQQQNANCKRQAVCA